MPYGSFVLMCSCLRGDPKLSYDYNAILDNLTRQAKESPRLRAFLDLRNTPEGFPHRLLIAI